MEGVSTRCVLIVDDQPEHREIYRAVLERRGFQVSEAVDGEEAVRRAEEERPDLIVMDVMLPWMDGWEVTRRLKTTPRTAAIPVVAVSAGAAGEGRLRAEEAGCARFVEKSGDPRRLADAVVDLIGDPGS